MDNREMDVSVVIPMYNSESTITDVLAALEHQTAVKQIKEIIIVNDGSTDFSLQRVQEYQKHSSMMITIVNQKNQGVSTARNVGMQIAKTSWIALNDSDDYWYPQKLERQLNVLKNNPQIDFLGCGHIDCDLKILSRKITNLYKASVKDICFKMFPQPSTAIFKRKIYEELGGFDVGQHYAEDGNYFLKICLKYNYYYLPEKLINYGDGKRGFGVSGLSANLPEMYRGNVKNIKELKKERIISNKLYIFLRFFYWCKYIHRILLTLGNKGK